MIDREKKTHASETEPTEEQEEGKNVSFYTPFVISLVVANVVIIGLLTVFALRQWKQPPIVEEKPAPAVAPLGVIAQADRQLLNGRTQEAIEMYRLALKQGSPRSTTVAYRLGLCMELAGDLKESLEYYKIANNQDMTETSLAATLGEARVFFKLGQFSEASKTLSPLSRVAALPVLASTPIGPQVSFMTALSLSSTAQLDLPRAIIDPQHRYRESIDVSVEEALRLVPLEGNQLNMQIPIGDSMRVGVQILGQATEPSTTLASCGFQNQPATVLLELIARESGWKISLTPSANEVLSAKRIEVHLQDATISELLSKILAPQALFWTFQNDTLVIDRVEHFPRELVDIRRLNRADALLAAALADAPNHPLAPQAYLALGNLASIGNRVARATTFYQDINQRFPKHPISQLANMNLAKLLLSQKRGEEAKEALFQVVDRRGDRGQAPLAFLFLGGLHIANEDSEKAKRALSRSLALASDPQVRANAAMTLAAVYLMQRSEATANTANAILMEHRKVLQDPRWQDVAVFLSSVTRYRTAIRPSDIQRRGRELVSSAVRVDPSSFFGDHGYLLVGDAFSELSLGSEATRTYAAGLKQDIPDSIRDLLLYRLATEHRDQNDFSSAKSILAELSTKTASGMAPLAAVDLAKMLLRDGQFQQCVQHCRQALGQDFAEPQTAKLLSVLGHAYEELGRHEQASLCFGGFLPGSVAVKTAEVSR